MNIVSDFKVPLPTALTEIGLADTFAGRHFSKLRYVKAWGKWFVWDGRVWREDKTSYVVDLVRDLCEEAGLEADSPAQKSKLQSKRTIDSVDYIARSDRRIAATTDQWDRDPWLLNTPDGVVDLKTGELRKAKPEDYMTKSTAVGPAGECPLWLKFLAKIFNKDDELVGYMQRLSGYMLTGSTREQQFGFGYGTGKNGKTVLLGTLSGIMSAYHRELATEALVATHFDRHPTDIAGLVGARLTTANETQRGRKWNESLIKKMTGGDILTARFMRQDFFDFLPEFKLFVAGNYKPEINGVDVAIRRRLHLIPFTVTIPVSERDPDLAEKLKAEWPGILRWMIAGCLEWQKQGLNPPKAVVDASNAYFDEQDTLQAWIDDCCEVDRENPELWDKVGSLYKSWKEWCTKGGNEAGSSRAFTDALAEAGFQRNRTGPRGRHFWGIRLDYSAEREACE
jgi:putative DNA primase/helicase